MKWSTSYFKIREEQYIESQAAELRAVLAEHGYVVIPNFLLPEVRLHSTNGTLKVLTELTTPSCRLEQPGVVVPSRPQHQPQPHVS